MESDEFWEMFWEVSLKIHGLETLGKKEAILILSQMIRQQARALGRPLRLLELGSGEGQIIGSLVEAHAQLCSTGECIGIDNFPAAVWAAGRMHPAVRFLEGDFSDPVFMGKLGQFDIVVLVNSLHEVFSDGFSAELGEVDVPAARQRVAETFSLAARRVAPGGYLVLFDGLEPPGDLQQPVRLRFRDEQALANFKTFAHQYRPFHIIYRVLDNPNLIELSRRDFTRYITKSIFLGKHLWKIEREESYQYFTEDEFRAVFKASGLEIQELRTFTVNKAKWRRAVKIESRGVVFPEEHILIIGQNKLRD